MKSHKDLKEQSAFGLALLTGPNPHMLHCTTQPEDLYQICPPQFYIREETDTWVMSASVTPTEDKNQCLEQITNPYIQLNKVFVCLRTTKVMTDKY